MRGQGLWLDHRAGGASSSGQGLGLERGQAPGGGWASWQDVQVGPKEQDCTGGILKMESDLRMQGPAATSPPQMTAWGGLRGSAGVPTWTGRDCPAG